MATVEALLAQIEAAFADIPRPRNDELLHPNCADDNDIAALYEVADWRDLSDATIENEYAALSFLSPAGFRCFIPAYMSFTLRFPESGAAAVESTLWSLSPVNDQHFNPSKFILFDVAQSAAVVASLEALAAHEEVDDALLFWMERVAQLGEM
jgi:hypothetical protein